MQNVINLMVYSMRVICCRIRTRQMWVRGIIQNSVNRVNSLSRSRKIILVILMLLVLLYYLGPLLFGKRNRSLREGCLAEKLQLFQSEVDNLDAFINHVPPLDGEQHFPPYVGNGKVAVAFGSHNGLFIRLNRALSLPVNFYPIIGTALSGYKADVAHVLQIRKGLAYRLQSYNMKKGCVYVGSRIYAHRSRSSVLVHEIKAQNPTNVDFHVDLDQIRASGWTDSTVTTHSAKNFQEENVSYSVTSGLVSTSDQSIFVAAAIASVSVNIPVLKIPAGRTERHQYLTVVHYSSPFTKEEANQALSVLEKQARKELEEVLKIEPGQLRREHTSIWSKLWESGFSISSSKAVGAINGDKINSTMYYVLSNVPSPLNDPLTSKEDRTAIMKTLYYPDRCYKEHTTLHSTTLWVDPYDEDGIARIVATWIITLEKQGCNVMIQAGTEGVLQAMLLSIGALRFSNDHLEFWMHPKDLHRDFVFHRINYGNNTHLNISAIVGEDNKASLYAALDRNDKPYFACDAGCIDLPVQLSKEKKMFPVKLTEPLTSILYITADKFHMEELKHAIHVKEIVEAPAHEHHVIAMHRHGHHLGGLPTIFWVSIAFLVIVFHLFLFKLICNEYCQAQERFTRGRRS
ncbi:hypothetical protein CHS0354_030125 [Potamilus streckersoni]|uniref:Uncharacterized protein n=1 Tax=Potamilus streckersoni TaxID=2493646 RepID=A0AAE0ST72_9BIVA|nr:hypothetical protein CHS0354_030125 [Potamilus streckersoni]